MSDRDTATTPSAHDCGCSDYTVSRRALLRTAGLVGAGGVVTRMFGDVLTSTAYGSTNGNVLVVLSLRGGADGLSMVVPHAEAAYAAARPSSALKAGALLHADATFGLHPAFAPISDRWRAGQVAAVHAVGMLTPNRSHFEAMEAVEDADPGSAERVGWINRMISGLVDQPSPLDALQLGTTTTPTSLYGPAPTVATRDLGQLSMPFSDNPTLQRAVSTFVRERYSAAGGLVGSAAIDALALAERAGTIAKVADTAPAGGATYAQYSEAGSALAHAAALIKAGLGVRAVAVDAGGWDHHVGLRWNVEARIKELATNLAAFFTDLGSHAGRVTVVTLSEFGRRLQENGSSGVDHGYGSCVLAMGAGVKGGYHARWPGLSAADQVDGDLAVTTDYRDVVAEILRSRFPDVSIGSVFPGLVQKPIGMMTAASTVAS